MDTVEIAIQINGQVKFRMMCHRMLIKAMEKRLEDDKVSDFLKDREIVKVIAIPAGCKYRH